MISATNLSMRYGGKILFKQANFQLLPKGHYGLVGPNGAGKSTLIKILTGEIIPESGEIAIPNNLMIGTLKQDHFLYDQCPIRDVVLMGKPKLWQAMQQKAALLERGDFTESECEILAGYEKTIEENHGYTAPSEAAQLLEGLGIPLKRQEEPMSVLSGGYKLRVLLAQLLFSNPDALLLDEPTNHLDIFSIRWLEEYLTNFPGILLLSSHDRHFLNGICNYILDLDYETIKTYKGNYSSFELAKEQERNLKETLLAKQDKRKEEILGFVDRFKAKASKARQAQSKMKLVEKLEESIDALDLQPSSRCYPKLNFEICRHSGAIVLKADALAKSYGSKCVLNNITFEIERGQRVAFLGVNGIGKSTLLEILTGNIASDHGAFSWGFAAHCAYFPQDHSKEVNGSLSLLDWLGQFDSKAPQEQLRQILARVLFSGDAVEKTVNVLSGGETARLILAKMMLAKHNVLVFDEPTNHLDMEATEALIQSLEKYEGTILFVSHNRHFVEKMATRIIEMTSEGIQDFKCNFVEYLEKRNVDLLQATKTLRTGNQERVSQRDSNETSKQNHIDQKKRQRQKEQLQRKVNVAEEKCHRLEIALKEIEVMLAEEGFYQKTAKSEQSRILAEKERIEAALQNAFEEWEQASHQLSVIP